MSHIHNNIFAKSGKDSIYNSLKNEINPRCKESKLFVESLCDKANKYVDKNFLIDLPDQFHQRFWEIYLATSLLEIGKNLEPNDRNYGADICISSDDDSIIWVEAVTVSLGQSEEAQEKEDEAMDVPDEQIKLRLLNAFSVKSEKYKHYRRKNWITDKEPYIIAINAAQVPLSSCEREIPRIIRSLLPFGDEVLYFDRETLKTIKSIHNYQGVVIKKSGTEIETTSFLNIEHSGISAIIYSCADVFNYRSRIGESLLLFHNPKAMNPLPLGFLKKGCEYWIEDQHLRSKNWNQI